MNMLSVLMTAFLLGGGDPTKTDLDKLQGNWVMVSMETESHEVEAEDIKDNRAVYEQNHLTLKTGDRVRRRGIVTLDPAASRRRLTPGTRMAPTTTRPCRAFTNSRATRSSSALHDPARNDRRSSRPNRARLFCCASTKGKRTESGGLGRE